MPRKIWLVITPELPRAPMSAPKLIAAATRSAGCAGDRLRLVERGPDRREHVRAGVAVGDRVDVQAVDLLDVGLEVGDGRPERLEEPGPVTGPAPHQATSVPLSARSRGRMAVGSAWTTVGGAPAGWTRRPSTWMTRRRTSRSSAWRSA